MRLLLDTHVFLWLDSDPNRLSPAIRKALEDESVSLVLSVVSVWEIVIKSAIGKLEIAGGLEEALRAHQEKNRLQILPVSLAHTLELQRLPMAHSDPFDRLLIAQAISEGLSFVTADAACVPYPVQIVW